MWLVSGNPFDVTGARACGMKAAWVDRQGNGWQDSLGGDKWKPSVVLKGLDELPKVLEVWTAKQIMSTSPSTCTRHLPCEDPHTSPPPASCWYCWVLSVCLHVCLGSLTFRRSGLSEWVSDLVMSSTQVALRRAVHRSIKDQGHR